ncbi:dihydrofolate reductase family protein [Demequina silvatica]|uniref:dihydrofolate reductase family protein n=1 Tax=Demequina silvatica TaxID=1638988 RepID=UPI0007844DCB|nr:dihydrofolate reductase family protein [Demequina silvatica]
MTRVRAYLAMSLDGMVAAPGDGLDWLEPRAEGAPPVADEPWSSSDDDALHFGDFLDRVGCIVMGRRTFDIVTGFPDWPYRDLPMLVATHRPLEHPNPAVAAARGTIAEIVDQARELAGRKDVYVDGATMVRDALASRVLDELVVTVVPTVLGQGTSLFGGMAAPAELTAEHVVRFGDGFVQIHLSCPAADR